MSKKSKQDWLDIGLKVLGREGLPGLTIQGMAKEMDLTKGSFYHHFENIKDFEQRLLEHWANQYFSTSDRIPDTPTKRLLLLDRLMEETFSPITEPEVAIRMWAAHDSRARTLVERVDTQRRQFLVETFSNLIPDEERTQLMTDMLFTITIGSMTVLPRIPPERVLALYREFKRLYKI
ncbi:MAG: TetR family transcriptional regulator [Anaerolineales bacterium]|nr:TetR family transcriptional regulator [Anaerolineales bacterium]